VGAAGFYCFIGKCNRLTNFNHEQRHQPLFTYTFDIFNSFSGAKLSKKYQLANKITIFFTI